MRTHQWTLGATAGGAGDEGGTVRRLRRLETSLHDAHDELSIFFDEAVPAYRVEYLTEPPRDCGSGRARETRGEAALAVRLADAVAHTEGGMPTIQPDAVRTDGALITDLVRTCDFEGRVTLVLGLTERVPYRAQVRDDPPRLILGVRRPRGAPVPPHEQCHLTPRQPALPTIALRYPRGWAVSDPDAGPCRMFDPRDPTIEPRTENPGVAIRAYVDAVSLDRATDDPWLDETSRATSAVDDRRAVRITGEARDGGLHPAGTRRTVWLVDAGDAETPGVLFISGASVEGVDVRSALDEIARSADIDPNAAESDPSTVVGFTETGAHEVRWDGSCFTLHPVGESRSLDRTCPAPPVDSPLSATTLATDGDLRVAIGFASDRIDVVRAGERAAIPVAISSSGGALGFAVSVSDAEVSLVGETFDGSRIAEARVVAESRP